MSQYTSFSEIYIIINHIISGLDTAKALKEDQGNLAHEEKLVELTSCPLAPVLSRCLKPTPVLKMNNAIQVSSRSRVMSLRRVSCCFMSRQCLIRMSTDSSGPMSVTEFPQAASAGRVLAIRFCPIATGLISARLSVNRSWRKLCICETCCVLY